MESNRSQDFCRGWRGSSQPRVSSGRSSEWRSVVRRSSLELSWEYISSLICPCQPVHIRWERSCGRSIRPASVGSRRLPTIGTALVSGGARERRRTRAVSSGGRRFTLGCALGSHRRNTERRALVTTVSGIRCLCQCPAGPACVRRTPRSCRISPAVASSLPLIGYDDPACAGMNRSAGNTAATDMDFSSQAAFEQHSRVAHQKIERVAKAASQVIDALEVLDRVDPNGRFRGRLDLDRIGVVGYSLGGAIAMQLCWRDDRLKAAVNIDGWLFDAAAGGWIEQPFMFISDDSPAATSADLSNPNPAHRYPAILDDTTRSAYIQRACEARRRVHHRPWQRSLRFFRHGLFEPPGFVARTTA